MRQRAQLSATRWGNLKLSCPDPRHHRMELIFGEGAADTCDTYPRALWLERGGSCPCPRLETRPVPSHVLSVLHHVRCPLSGFVTDLHSASCGTKVMKKRRTLCSARRLWREGPVKAG